MWHTIESVLRGVERRLAEYAARTLGAEIPNQPTSLDTLTLEELEDRPPDSSKYASSWGIWEHREEEYYRACHDTIRRLDRRVFESTLVDEEMANAINKARAIVEQIQRNSTMVQGI